MKTQAPKSEVLSWSLFSVAGIAASILTAGLVPRIVHASAHTMFEEEAELETTSTSLGGDEKGRWDGNNNPANWSSGYEYRFDRLPLEGNMKSHQPWSDTYWPSNRAGIAARWNLEGSNGFKYKMYNLEQLRAMSPAQIARLSPAEKYDILMGRYDYPTVKAVRGKTSSHAKGWEGICHGWSPASLNHAEPAPVTVTSKDGIEIAFGSADVKGILDNYYADHAQADSFLGARCKKGGGGWRGFIGHFRGAGACEDVNAGAFHVILTNELGQRGHGFVADVDRSNQVWNQPVFGFSSKVMGMRSPSRDSAPGTVREVLIHTTMFYADEIAPAWDPVVGTKKYAQDKKEYDYAIELDSAGRIVGGQYYLKSNPSRPDFLWSAPRLGFTGYYMGLNKIYRPAPTPAMPES
jgi:hypothetical protein